MNINFLKLTFLGSLLLASLGCGNASLSPVEGKVVLGPNVDFQFAGDTLEIRSGSNPSEVAYAEIQNDGSFSIESLQSGKIVRGANPGEYQARIVISTDDFQHKATALKTIPKKYLKFETSQLVVVAPSTNNTLTIQR